MSRKVFHILFFPVLLVILIATNFLIDPVRLYENDQVNTRNRNFAGVMAARANMDVLVMGDSESYTSFSPLQCWNEYGIPVYNCGMQGQNLIETYSELKAALKTQHPKILLMEAYLLSRYEKPLKSAQLILAEQFYQLFPALRFHSSWRTVFYTESEKAQERDWPKGFHIVTIVAHEEAAEREEADLTNIKMSKINRFYFSRIEELCRKNDIQLIFYSSPSPKNYSKRRVEYIREFAESQGIPYVNLLDHMEEMGLDLTVDSYDGGDHLNLSGARKSTSFLGRYLAEECGLESRKGDPAYDSWNEDAKAYKKQVKKMMKKWKKNAETLPEAAVPVEGTPEGNGAADPAGGTEEPAAAEEKKA